MSDLKVPAIFKADHLLTHGARFYTGNPDDGWKLARPEPYRGLCFLERLKVAWLVFKGNADALVWSERKKP